MLMISLFVALSKLQMTKLEYLGSSCMPMRILTRLEFGVTGAFKAVTNAYSLGKIYFKLGE